MNYIYSVFKRSNTNAHNHTSTYFSKYVIVAMFSYVCFVMVNMLLLEKVIFTSRNTIYEITIGLLCVFIVVYPLIYALIPGYNFLESVQKYTVTKATIISLIIIMLPIFLTLLVIYSL